MACGRLESGSDSVSGNGDASRDQELVDPSEGGDDGGDEEQYIPETAARIERRRSPFQEKIVDPARPHVNKSSTRSVSRMKSRSVAGER